MKREDVVQLPPGLYRIFWKKKYGGGTSLASVGVTRDGGRWMAPSNWVSPSQDHDQKSWSHVKHVESIPAPT